MTASAIITAIIDLLKAIPILDSWFSQIVAAWMNGQTQDTLSAISDASAFAARAQTDDDRYKASQMWQQALQRKRVTG